MIEISVNNYGAYAKAAGIDFYEDGRLNIVGYRNEFGRANYFDDTISVYVKHDSWRTYHYEAATLPGFPNLLKPVNMKGTALLVPGQYVNCYSLGMHRNKYRALVQVEPVKVYRDNNKDMVYDLYDRTVDIGLFGINIHRASFGAKVVGLDGAGCQVIKSSSDFLQFIKICEEAMNSHGNRFTYTLVKL